MSWQLYNWMDNIYCQGDSGGPLTYQDLTKNGSQHILIEVVSGGNPLCATVSF